MSCTIFKRKRCISPVGLDHSSSYPEYNIRWGDISIYKSMSKLCRKERMEGGDGYSYSGDFEDVKTIVVFLDLLY